MDHNKLTDEAKELMLTGVLDNDPGYVLINDIRLEGIIYLGLQSLNVRLDVRESFFADYWSTVKIYRADGTLLFSGLLGTDVLSKAGERLILTSAIRIE